MSPSTGKTEKEERHHDRRETQCPQRDQRKAQRGGPAHQPGAFRRSVSRRPRRRSRERRGRRGAAGSHQANENRYGRPDRGCGRCLRDGSDEARSEGFPRRRRTGGLCLPNGSLSHTGRKANCQVQIHGFRGDRSQSLFQETGVARLRIGPRRVDYRAGRTPAFPYGDARHSPEPLSGRGLLHPGARQGDPAGHRLHGPGRAPAAAWGVYQCRHGDFRGKLRNRGKRSDRVGHERGERPPRHHPAPDPRGDHRLRKADSQDHRRGADPEAPAPGGHGPAHDELYDPGGRADARDGPRGGPLGGKDPGDAHHPSRQRPPEGGEGREVQTDFPVRPLRLVPERLPCLYAGRRPRLRRPYLCGRDRSDPDGFFKRNGGFRKVSRAVHRMPPLHGGLSGENRHPGTHRGAACSGGGGTRIALCRQATLR